VQHVGLDVSTSDHDQSEDEDAVDHQPHDGLSSVHGDDLQHPTSEQVAAQLADQRIADRAVVARERPDVLPAPWRGASRCASGTLEAKAA
jgi:hypothetical protein